jgi:hypothetical protein
MSSVAPKFADDTVRANPLAWSAQLTVPDPIVQGAYPIAGFTDFGYYQCYASASDLSGIFAYVKFHWRHSRWGCGQHPRRAGRRSGSGHHCGSDHLARQYRPAGHGFGPDAGRSGRPLHHRRLI